MNEGPALAFPAHLQALRAGTASQSRPASAGPLRLGMRGKAVVIPRASTQTDEVNEPAASSSATTDEASAMPVLPGGNAASTQLSAPAATAESTTASISAVPPPRLAGSNSSKPMLNTPAATADADARAPEVSFRPIRPTSARPAHHSALQVAVPAPSATATPVAPSPPAEQRTSRRLTEFEPGSIEALYHSFDPRRRQTQTVRKSLADVVVRGSSTAADAAPGSALLRHPYPPRHAQSMSVGMAQSHAYVYGHRANVHAARAIAFLAQSPASGAADGQQKDAAEDVPVLPVASSSQSPRSVVGRHSAAARAHSLYLQLRQFTHGAPVAKAQVKGSALLRAYEDFAYGGSH